MAKEKKRPIVVPKSIEEVSLFVSEIGKCQRKLEQIQTRINEDIEQIKTRAVQISLPLQETIDELFKSIYVFARAHRSMLTDGGKRKRVDLLTGSIFWQLNPPAVSLRNVKKVIALCKRHRLKRFIRVKEELDKEAMLKEPEMASRIKGVRIGQKEQFVVKPAEVVEIVRDTKKLKKVLPKK